MFHVKHFPIIRFNSCIYTPTPAYVGMFGRVVDACIANNLRCSTMFGRVNATEHPMRKLCGRRMACACELTEPGASGGIFSRAMVGGGFIASSAN